MKQYRKIDLYIKRGKSWHYLASTCRYRTLAGAIASTGIDSKIIRAKRAEPENKFRLLNGELTAYAFACGYIQSHIWGGQELHLRHTGGYVYDLRGFNQSPFERIFWDTFESLTDARKAYRARVRQMRQGGMQ